MNTGTAASASSPSMRACSDDGFRRGGGATFASDVYRLGVLLFEVRAVLQSSDESSLSILFSGVDDCHCL